MRLVVDPRVAFLLVPPVLAAAGALVGNLIFSLVVPTYSGTWVADSIALSESNGLDTADTIYVAVTVLSMAFRLLFPAALAVLLFLPSPPPWRLGASRGQWAVFGASAAVSAVAFLSTPAYISSGTPETRFLVPRAEEALGALAVLGLALVVHWRETSSVQAPPGRGQLGTVVSRCLPCSP